MLLDQSIPVLLYGFAQNATADDVQSITRACRLAVDFLDDRPAWAHDVLGVPFRLCTLCGEYGGHLASYEGTVRHTRPDAAELFRKRHPEWSSAKIDRALDEKAKHAAKPVGAPDAQLAMEKSLAAHLNVIRELLKFGPLTLALVTDPKLVARTPRVTMEVDAVDAEYLLKFPVDTIVRFVAHRRNAGKVG